jgi:Tol biopolymer transport system component
MSPWRTLLLLVILAAAHGAQARGAGPEFTGQLLFHRYSSYDAWDSKLYLYDYKTGTLTCLSAAWAIDHAMNAHFSSDGRSIVFMGVPRGRHDGRSWDIFLCALARSADPVDLTARNGLRDEDPSFSPDGKTIVFKQDGRVKFVDVATRKVRPLRELAPGVEWSMPVFTTNGRAVVAMTGARASGDLYAVNLDGTKLMPIATTRGVQEYFPVAWDANRLLYVRWLSADNRNDQIYCYRWRDKKAERLPLWEDNSNASDPCPADDRWVFFSSTRSGGKGGYDLYAGDSVSGRAFPLAAEGINTPAEELGACYRRR